MKQAAFLPIMSAVSMGILLAPLAKADPVYEATTVTFSGPVEIPGMVLTAGTYVIKLLDPYGDRDIVRFYNADESRMYAMVFGVRDYRLAPPDHTIITFEERAANSPPAVKEWIPAGENWGEEFVYSKPPVIAAAVASSPAPPVAAAPQPAPAPVARAQPQPAPVQIAQAQPYQPPAAAASPAPAPTTVSPAQELPKTASVLPLLASLGAMLTLAGALLRWTAA